MADESIVGNPAAMAGLFSIRGFVVPIGAGISQLCPADAERVSLIISITGGIAWIYPGGADSGNGLIVVAEGPTPFVLTFKDHGSLVGLKWDIQAAGPPVANFADAVGVSFRPPHGVT